MRTAILTFHGIGAPARTLESGEAPYWIPRDLFLRILDRIAAPEPGDLPVAVTFDDGNRSDLEIAAPELVARGLTAQVFVLTGRLGAPGSLDAADVRALLGMGLGIGTHGIAHIDWKSAPAAVLAEEIGTSRDRLGAIAGGPVETAAVPFGRYDGRVVRALRRAGMRAIYTSCGGIADTRRDVRPRTSVRADTPLEAVSALIAGRVPWTVRLRRAAAMAVKTRLPRG